MVKGMRPPVGSRQGLSAARVALLGACGAAGLVAAFALAGWRSDARASPAAIAHAGRASSAAYTVTTPTSFYVNWDCSKPSQIWVQYTSQPGLTYNAPGWTATPAENYVCGQTYSATLYVDEGTTYYYMWVLQEEGLTFYDGRVIFTTPGTPPPPPPPPPGSTSAPHRQRLRRPLRRPRPLAPPRPRRQRPRRRQVSRRRSQSFRTRLERPV